ncbi:MAG: DUF4258 domain-containing protein [Bacillota bacterium]
MLFSFSYKGKEYKVKLTSHCKDRLKNRGIKIKEILRTLLQVKVNDLKSGIELMIRNIKEKLSLVTAINNTTITIITCMKKLAGCDNYENTQYYDIT